MIDDLVDRWQTAWMARDPTAFAQLCADDVHYEDPVCREPLEGAAAIAAHAELLWQVFPDVRVERAGERLHDGRFVAAPARFAGTHRGELENLPPSGRFVVVHVVWYAELDESGSRLWRVRSFFDAYDAAVQLGILPGHGTLSERALLMLRGFGLRARR